VKNDTSNFLADVYTAMLLRQFFIKMNAQFPLLIFLFFVYLFDHQPHNNNHHRSSYSL